MNNNCSVTQGPAYYTSIDIQNAVLYATNKIMYERTNEYALKSNNAIVWQPSNNDNSVSFPCPDVLKCVQGFPKIATKDECVARSKYDPNVPPGYKNGIGSWYLDWIPNSNDPTKGDCYNGNYVFHNQCDNDFSNGNTLGKGKLEWDNDTKRCLMTQAYCNAYGNDNYQPGNGPNGSGGTCQLSSGRTVSDALFGKTITSFFNGEC